MQLVTEAKPTYGRITSKGQVTIPKEIRETLGVNYGDRVDFIERNGEIIVKKHFDRAAFDAAIEKWRGTVKLPDNMTVDEYIDYIRGE